MVCEQRWSRRRLLNERVAKHLEIEPCGDEGHAAALRALAEETALVKSVNNEGWTEFASSLQGTPRRTPTSLPPAGGKHMHLFGKVTVSSVGLIWDMSQLDLAGAFMWPSGYNAKSEFNVTEHGILLNGRKEALVTPARLRHDNSTLTYYSEMHERVVSADVLPWNEVLVRVDGAQGLIGVFARSVCVSHLLLAMGVRALLLKSLQGLRELPLFVLDEVCGARPFGLAAQRCILHEYASFLERPILDPPSLAPGVPCLPVDLQGLGLHPLEQLSFHGAHGLTEEALRALLAGLLRDGGADAPCACESPCDEHPCTNKLETLARRIRALPRAYRARVVFAFGLQASVEANNAASAESLLLALAPLLSATLENEQHSSVLIGCAGSTDQSTGSTKGLDFATFVRELTGRALSPRLHIVLGAVILLDELLSGRMLRHIKEVCKELEDWLASSESLTFRLMSWRKLCHERQFTRQESPSIYAFITRKAIVNRSQFHAELLHLQECYDVHECLRGVHELVMKLNNPSLRLQTLRFLLGLDDNYDLKSVAGITRLSLQAFTRTTGICDPDIDADIATASAGPWDRSVSAP